MPNKHKIPENHPVAVIGYILAAVGIILFFSSFFPRPDVNQSYAEFRRAMDSSSMRAFGGMGLMFLGSVVRAIAEWSWNNSQPVQSISVQVVSKWTTTHRSRRLSDFDELAPSLYDEYTSYHAKFEARNGQTMDFTLSLDLYNQFAERDFGTLTFQGGRIHTFRRR